MREKPTVEAQLGYYIGEFIFHKHLPTLSTDMLRSRKVINVSEEDANEHERLETAYRNYAFSKDRSKNEKKGEHPTWIELRKHGKMLEEKYLPHVLKCYVPQIYVDNIDEVKKGIIASLWDCDMCAYSLKPENIKISTDEWFTVVELLLGVTVND
jgi:hypothetical protein